MAALPDLITVEQYRRLPDDGVHRYELHQGEIVEVTQPTAGHWKLQRRLERLLQPKLASFGEVGIEFAYRAIPEFDLRAADVAAVSKALFEAMRRDGSSAVYEPGSAILLAAFGSDSLPLTAIFE